MTTVIVITYEFNPSNKYLDYCCYYHLYQIIAIVREFLCLQNRMYIMHILVRDPESQIWEG